MKMESVCTTFSGWHNYYPAPEVTRAEKEYIMAIEIDIQKDSAFLYTPYNEDFISRIKQTIGGTKWDKDRRAWRIPVESVPDAREIMRDVFGECDIPSDEAKVTVRLTFSEKVTEQCGPVRIFGKTISHARGRDSGAHPGEDVSIISGTVTSGGSRQNWESVVEPETVALLRNVSEHMLKKELPEGVTFEIVQEDDERRAKLVAEKEKLLARIAEIEKTLESMGSQA